MTTDLDVTPDQYAKLKQAEAVTVCEYERADGSRFAIVVGIGDLDEMQVMAATPELAFVPDSLKIIGKQCVKVADLIPPSEDLDGVEDHDPKERSGE